MELTVDTAELLDVEVEFEKYFSSQAETAASCRRAETMMSTAATMKEAATARPFSRA
jgi:pyruvate kinase